MDIMRIAAFSDRDSGGNPAGVVLAKALPPASAMQARAAAIGYSETVFAEPDGDSWRVRYFSPESEVPFCGHATIALGAALAKTNGDGVYKLSLNEAGITVEGWREGVSFAAALQSPPTRSVPADPHLIADVLSLFGYAEADLDPRIDPAVAEAGATHLVLALAEREKLAAMPYDFYAGRDLMIAAGLDTIALVHAETPRLFHARNAFASGGVYEDPATGAAAAALAGYLRDIGWMSDGRIRIVQGEDMGMRSRIHVEMSAARGSSVRVAGKARLIERPNNSN